MEDLESQVNDLLLSNGWDYEDRKRVLFMLRNRKPRKRANEIVVVFQSWLAGPWYDGGTQREKILDI